MPLKKQRRPLTHLEVSRSFEASIDAAGAARRFVVETPDQAGVAEGIDDAKLVVTELATNSVLHAGSDFTVSVSVTDSDLCIPVSDESPDLPTQTEQPSEEGAGRDWRSLPSWPLAGRLPAILPGQNTVILRRFWDVAAVAPRFQPLDCRDEVPMSVFRGTNPFPRHNQAWSPSSSVLSRTAEFGEAAAASQRPTTDGGV